MKNKRLFIIIAVLIVLTAIIAVIHLTTRTPEIEGAILVNCKTLEISSLDFNHVSGSLVNGKGEEKQIDAQGVLLSEVCGGEFSTATVTASDEYSAVVKSGEDAYLILSDDGSLRLIVFGDENSKRDVKDVVRIDFE